MSEATAQKKKVAKLAEHPKYIDMIVAALSALKERNGSSRQAIEKYIRSNYKVGDNCGSHIRAALKRGAEESGKLIHTKGKGASGSFKVNKAVELAEKKSKKKVVKKPAVKKTAAKKPVAKKPAVKKSAVKKTAAKKSDKKEEVNTKKVTKKPAAKAKPANKPVVKKSAAKKPAKKAAAKMAVKSPKKK